MSACSSAGASPCDGAGLIFEGTSNDSGRIEDTRLDQVCRDTSVGRQQPVEKVAALRKPSGLIAFYHAKPGGSLRYQDWLLQRAVRPEVAFTLSVLSRSTRQHVVEAHRRLLIPSLSRHSD